jgi:hypothetical protein
MAAPHAPWWDFSGLETEFGSFLINPRASILRCLLDYGELVPEGFLPGVLGSLMDYLETMPPALTFFDAISLLQLLQSERLPDDCRQPLQSRLREAAKDLVNPNPAAWHEFAVKPLWLAPSPAAILADVLMPDIQHNLDFEVEHQGQDGAWSPTWSWGVLYPETWPTAAREWKGVLTLATLRSLRDYGRTEGGLPVGGDTVYRYHLD